MKLFHTENGKETVYVQMQDIMYLLNETDMPIPATILKNFFIGVTIVTDKNRFDFVRFEDEHEVEFFKKIEFIIDFDQYKGLTEKQIESEAQKLIIKANKIAEKWNHMTLEEKNKNRALYEEHCNISYMVKFLSEIYNVKQGKKDMPFPKFVELPKKTKKKLFFRRKKDVKK